MNSKDFYIDSFKKFESKLNGESKLFIHQLRKEALKQFETSNFPTQKNEEWKYTDVSPIVRQSFIPAVNAVQVSFSKEEVGKYLFKDVDCHLLVFINGLFSEELSLINELPKGVVVGNLRNLSKENPGSIEKYFGKLSKIENSFNSLNAAYSVDGLVAIVPDGKIVEKPIQVLYLNSSANEEVLSSPRNLIVAGKNSQVSVIANYRGVSDKSYLSNNVTEVFVDEYAVVSVYKIQNELDEAYHIEKVQAKQGKNSVFNHYNIAFGGAIVRNDINAVHNGENIETHYYGLYMINGKQHVDNHTFVDHAKPNCMSNELYKGILDENARGVFNGKIIVRQDAQKTNAYQQNKTILLSKSATIDTKPQLEIFADDVKCSHGATVGHLDEVSEFYIRSRGVPQELAKSMLIRAFANDVIETIKIEPLKEQINHMIFEHLHKIEVNNE
ncbi:MAG: Fe-S cluster assembly protein SufD [Ignavibacteria bacterium]|nr:MAG: Fe-S cluster assembly protein SufD [Ignavibacteria bacterium]KAF0160089.1 MAG: Fe-S cluster assembly protein SufD [Ignavibacteria bacterium]